MTRLWLIAGGALLGVLLVASVVLSLTRQEATFAPDSPEGVVQRLLKAVREQDYETAHSLLSAELREKCSVEDLAGSGGLLRRGERDFQVILEDSRSVGEAVVVRATVTEFYGGGLFGPSESTWQVTYTLRQEDGRWRFSDYPWPLAGPCPEPVPPLPRD